MIECVWYNRIPEGAWEPGWCFPLGDHLSLEFIRTARAFRPPISVVLPSRRGHPTRFCVDRYPSTKPDGHWKVTIEGMLINGARPDITVEPSINCEGDWHGYLTHGVLSDDLG